MGADDSLRAQNRGEMFLNNKQKASLNIASVNEIVKLRMFSIWSKI
jgi:hypothetical protein